VSKHDPVTDWPDQPLEYDKDVPDEGEGHAWIQWKGTNVCMDVQCRCGAHGHVDADFAYFYHCQRCGTTFCVGQTVRLYPIDQSAAGKIIADGRCVVTDPSVREGN